MTRFEPLPGESFNGLTARYAASQRIDRLKDLTDAAGVEHGHRQNAATLAPANIAALAEAMSIKFSELENRALPPVGNLNRAFNNVIISMMDIETRKRLFAPGGLAISPHHRSSWQLKAFPFCTESWQFLIATCPRTSCGATQRWYHSVGIQYCDRCMQDLREALASTVPVEHRRELKLAAGLLDYDPAQQEKSVRSLPSEISGLGPSGIYELFSCLLPLVDDEVGRRGSRRNWSMPATQLTIAVAKAWSLLSGWPGSMHAFIASELAFTNSEKGVAASGTAVRFLKNAQGNIVSPPVRTVIAGLFHHLNIVGGSSTLRPMEIKAASRCIGLGTA